MNKLILRTTLITTGIFVAIVCVLYGIFALFFPVNIAGFLDDLGLKDASVSFYELQYENTGDINDLGVLCVKVDEEEDSLRAKKYLTILTEHQSYSEYLERFDEKSTGSIMGREFFNGKLGVAIKKVDGVEAFITFAKDSVKDGYEEFNCFRIALSTKGLFTSEELGLVKTALLEIEPTLSENEKAILSRDLEFINV